VSEPGLREAMQGELTELETDTTQHDVATELGTFYVVVLGSTAGNASSDTLNDQGDDICTAENDSIWISNIRIK
jgi:hypothetical protein